MAKKLISPGYLKAKRQIEVSIGRGVLQRTEEKVARDYQKKVAIRGFRPGRAPLHMVLTQYGDEIRSEAKELAVRTEVLRELKERGIEPVSAIRIVREEAKGDNLSVKAEFEVIPDFEFPDLASIKVERRVERVTAKDIDGEIESLRRSMAEYVPMDRPAQEGDVVVVDYVELNKDGKVVRRIQNALVPLRWGETDPTLYEAVRGKRKGEEAVVTRALTLEGGGELERKFVYKVKSVKEERLPAVNDELAQALGFSNVDEMREKIRQDIAERKNRDAEKDVEWAIVKEIYERIKFELPPSMVDAEFVALKEAIDGRVLRKASSIDDELRRIAEDFVRREIILDRFVEREGIQLSEEEIQQEIQRRAQGYRLNPEAFREQLERRGEWEAFLQTARRRKALEKLKSLVKMEVVIT